MAIGRVPSAWWPRNCAADASGEFWRGEFPSQPPFSTGPDTLFVAFVASAELGCFRSLGWPMPVRILDLYAEFRNRVNGIIGDRGLIAAMNYFLDTQTLFPRFGLPAERPA